ncbi:MAG: energy transducer TonB [Acetobacteraceae bacterium]|nr:energy transducer TonB [Acetobacteraceae bacterium]
MTEAVGAPTQTQPPEVRFGDEEAPGETDSVQSADLQLSPDPSAPNIPPRYPPVAARLGEQGLVVILVGVQPDGRANAEVYQSSGFPLLDEAARDAVARWRFRADNGNAPGPGARTLISVRFRLD